MTQIDFIENKIIKSQDLENLILKWRENNQKIVFTNGCFDLLHLGHMLIILLRLRIWVIG